ncbi:MAG: cytochrome C [Acidobacteriota bacterium]
MKRKWLKMLMLVGFIGAGVMCYQVARAQEPKHPPVPGDGKNLVVQLCDGKTYIKVPGVAADGRMNAEQAQAVSNQLMSMWMTTVDKATAEAWAREIAEAQAAEAKGKKATAKKNAEVAQSPKEQPVDFSNRDKLIWEKELTREIEYGNQIFHSDQLIGSANGVACAMCHPNASNTHPETYPKFQIQLKKVALLRDMINWCIENPARGPRLAADDPKMRALEAYIMAQRKGVAMTPGKH